MLAGLAAEGAPVLVLARGAADAALLSAFGALLSTAWLAPAVLADAALMASLARVGWLSLAAAVLLTLVWLALQSADLSGSVAGMPLVLRGTLFGHLVLARLGLLGLALAMLARRRHWLAAGFAGAAVATQAGHGHGLAMYQGPSWLLLSGALHLLAASAWLGGLVPLLVLIASVPPGTAAMASARFSRLGSVCVTVLAGTALYQGSVLVGSLPRWTGTEYGRVALVKAGLFLVLLAFAARNRFRLTPALERDAFARAPASRSGTSFERVMQASGASTSGHHAPGGSMRGTAKTRLLRSIAGETAVGLLVVLAAGLLTALPPGMHEGGMHEGGMHEGGMHEPGMHEHGPPAVP